MYEIRKGKRTGLQINDNGLPIIHPYICYEFLLQYNTTGI